MRGRNEDGTFQSPFSPLKWGDAFTEGNSWHYTWSVFHDPQGLIDLMGGKEMFITMMDSVFAVPPIFDDSYYGQVIHEIREMTVMNMGNYAHGNQPIQHMIYLYDYAGQPWKAQYTLALSPRLVVCDEPVSALDVSVQAQMLNLLADLQAARGLTYVLVSHDLGVVRHSADRVCVMFLGRVCEVGPTEALFTAPRHPYTRFLLDSVPRPDPTRRGEGRELLPGEIPSPVTPPSGCRFRTRCPYAAPVCAQAPPPLQGTGEHRVACHAPFGEG